MLINFYFFINALTCTKSYSSSNASMDAGWNNSCHQVWILLCLYTYGRSTIFCHESWQNDISSFRSM